MCLKVPSGSLVPSLEAKVGLFEGLLLGTPLMDTVMRSQLAERRLGLS
jgi:hypothetical protein